ncbi:enoyl-CoA hydratase/isomerase family protein [Tahibacter amnicola]|uniref:Enoyl-CoA hydratase/isomerase family protein n=1 Tax=Tahibacter amnicola TaxID=2976241 RepID=A0ABY6BF07_9GAMM|nr:enoyl-CoA hydratase/isomerase family protein [Tahibacter amnicola]UXI67196.1 enoyl-CoA hydratase/isomerase family protein [Tahibacter amnicola]
MLELIRHDDTLEIQLARPPVNALDADLIRALKQAVEAAPGQGARAIILSGRSGMFSAGLDVPSLLQHDRDTMTHVWRDFFGLCGAIATSPIPIVAAITGHSPAGGAVLAIFCDYRVMARGPYRIGLNEVQVGLAVPEVIQFGLRRLVGPYRAERLMVSGAMVDAEQALSLGFVDELVDVDHVVARSQVWLNALLALPPCAMRETRRLSRKDLTEAFSDIEKLGIQSFIDLWFAEESQRVLRELVAKLKAKG